MEGSIKVIKITMSNIILWGKKSLEKYGVTSVTLKRVAIIDSKIM